MDNLKRKAKIFHKDVPDEYFNKLTYDELLCWLHPIDRKDETKGIKGAYENIFSPSEREIFNR